MAKIAVVLGSVRPTRAGAQVAEWVAAQAATVEGVEVNLIDLKELDLPVFAEEMPPSMAAPQEPKAQPWIQAISEADGVIFVTPEYNHSIPGALKNAIDFLTPASIANKAIGAVSYSFYNGIRPVEHLRLILDTFGAVVVPEQVSLSLATDFENMSVFKPAAYHGGEVPTMVKSVVAKSAALASLR